MNILKDRPKALKLIETWIKKKFKDVKLHRDNNMGSTYFIESDGLIVCELSANGTLHVMPTLYREVEGIFGLEYRTAELNGIFEMFFEKKFDVTIYKVECSWGMNLFGIGENINDL